MIEVHLEETLKDKNLFFLFSAALMMVTKSCRILAHSGADSVAIGHINKAVELISKQLDETAIHLETELQAMKETNGLLEKLGIPRKEPPEDGSDST